MNKKLNLVAQYIKKVREAPECDICHSDNYNELRNMVRDLTKTARFYEALSYFNMLMILVMVIASVFNVIIYIIHTSQIIKMMRCS